MSSDLVLGEKMLSKKELRRRRLVVQTVDDIDPDVPSNMAAFLAVEWTHGAPQSSWLKSVAPKNMPYMSFTLETSQFDMSPLNTTALWNILAVLRTVDTSHVERSPLNDLASRNI